jgi:hypothetical protein
MLNLSFHLSSGQVWKLRSASNYADTVLVPGVKTLALWDTSIKSQYCTNPTWLSTSIPHPALFNATLFVSSVHVKGLHGHVESSESLYYKAETIRCLNTALQDPTWAVADETIAAVMLLTSTIVRMLVSLHEMITNKSGF